MYTLAIYRTVLLSKGILRQSFLSMTKPSRKETRILISIRLREGSGNVWNSVSFSSEK
jgi:hypothetical protein